MNNIIKTEGTACLSNIINSADIKITLEQWPCTVAVLGICATYAFITWANRPIMKTSNKAS